MTLDKSIELNEQSEQSLRTHKFIDHADAIKLGNEALKRLQNCDIKGNCDYARNLPGETKE